MISNIVTSSELRAASMTSEAVKNQSVKMTNFSIAAIMNNDRGHSKAPLRPPSATSTNLGHFSHSNLNSPPLKDQIVDSNDNEDVDVEQWSDSEDQKKSPASHSSEKDSESSQPSQKKEEEGRQAQISQAQV